jgi:hypothetical protein
MISMPAAEQPAHEALIGVAWFYNSFRPLLNTSAGRAAVHRFELAPYIDGSCRREPDFESEFPSISGLCRKDKFAPRLHVGDTTIYVTTKGGWGRRLVAVLRVRERFESHDEAAAWYRELGLPLPSNCWVDGNPPIPYEQTVQDSSLPSVRERIQRWLDKEGHYPPAHSSEEYGFYVEQCYPIPDDRRAYFEGLRSGIEPFVGYRGLALLAKHDVITEVWTTNFDSLGAQAATSAGVAVLEAGLDSAHRVPAPRCR